MAKRNNQSTRRAPRFKSDASTNFRLPPRVSAPTSAQPKPGFHTYYVSALAKDFAPFVEKAERHHHKGFRGALLAPAGLQDAPPGFTIIGIQDGDVYEHAKSWAVSNPIDEYYLAFSARKQPVTLKEQEKAQDRFAEAVALVEAVKLEGERAETELDEATHNLIMLQGTEGLWVNGGYYDVSYSREKVYLRKRDPRFNPETSDDSEKRPKKAPARTRRSA